MISVEQCSQKFDFLCLHQTAWQRRIIRKPRSMDTSVIHSNIQKLLRRLIADAFKKYGLLFSQTTTEDNITVHVPELAEWLGTLENVPATQLVRPTQDNPNIVLYLKNGRIASAMKHFNMLERDLELYETLVHQQEQRTLSPFGKTQPRIARRRKQRQPA